ncbi:apolipoprotein F isoform X1 [Bubalus bubalis]|uniref:apolipoprotein F isoform X1 n=2 Tax=Bubalus bubalis TaxID=89462 RepID=UPI00042CB1AF|nr:apolipoprotein F isoform X1 [Bubalus bubalis]
MGQRSQQNRIEGLPNPSKQSHFLITALFGHSVTNLHGLRLIMLPVELLLCCFLLHAADAISSGNQMDVLLHLPSPLESSLTSSYPLSCQTLLPKSLPGFTQMAPLPRFLVSLALMIALDKAGCQGDVQVLQLQLYRQGGVNATQTLIRHLQELEKSRSTGRGVSVDALASALQLWARENPGPQRARRSPSIKDCEQEQEQNVHNIVQMLPGVGTFYNLGTAIYYAVQNCLDVAKERGRDGVIDLGYDLLMAMAGSSRGSTGLIIGTALKPALKAGVQRLIQYYYEREANTPPPETSKEVFRSTSDMSEVEETTIMAPFVSEVVSSNPCWGWTLFNNCGLDPRYWNIEI